MTGITDVDKENISAEINQIEKSTSAQSLEKFKLTRPQKDSQMDENIPINDPRRLEQLFSDNESLVHEPLSSVVDKVRMGNAASEVEDGNSMDNNSD